MKYSLQCTNLCFCCWKYHHFNFNLGFWRKIKLRNTCLGSFSEIIFHWGEVSILYSPWLSCEEIRINGSTCHLVRHCRYFLLWHTLQYLYCFFQILIDYGITGKKNSRVYFLAWHFTWLQPVIQKNEFNKLKMMDRVVYTTSISSPSCLIEGRLPLLPSLVPLSYHPNWIKENIKIDICSYYFKCQAVHSELEMGMGRRPRRGS